LHGIRAREHAVEDEGHVVGFEELSDGQHAAGFGFRLAESGFRLPACGFRNSAGTVQVHDFFGDREDAGFARHEEETVMGLAAEPARPAQAAIIQRTIKAMAGQRFSD
jgi:hypothetical protein